MVFQNAVDGGEVCNAFRHDAQRLCAVAAASVVHDKAWSVLGDDRFVSHLLGIVTQRSADAGVSFEASNDFDHFHQRDGIEEVIARELVWAL